MKITQIANSNGAQKTANIDEGHSASQDKIARAKAIVQGQTPQPQQQERAPSPSEYLQTTRRLRMNTKATPAGRDWAQPVETEVTDPAVTTQNDTISDPNEQATATTEDSKPLSPQFAALAKQRRALQVKEREIQAREEALKAAASSPAIVEAKALIERIKADPLGTVLEHGATYDQLTQQVLASMEGATPALTKVENELRNELKSLKEVIENQSKAQTDAQTAAEAKALAQMQKQADQIIATDDAYQMIRETKSNADVSKLIDRIRKEEGEILTVKEAMDMIEADLMAQGLEASQIVERVQAKRNPAPAPQQIQAPQFNDGMRRQTMRTLTNRDTVSSVPSRRDRAMAAAMGIKLV